MHTNWNESANKMESTVGWKLCRIFQVKSTGFKKAWTVKKIIAVAYMPAHASPQLFSIPGNQTVTTISFSQAQFLQWNLKLLALWSECKKQLGWVVTMPLCMGQHPCVPRKPHNIHPGIEVVLAWCQKPSKAFSHLPAKRVYLFVDWLYLLHNFSKERVQALIPPLGLRG